MNLTSIPVSQLIVSKQNVRNDADEVNGNQESTIDDLANSIKANGLLNPLSVRATGDGFYEVFAGQRRMKAIQKLNYTTVMCNVFPESMSDDEAKVKSLVENFQRQENSYKDKVEAFSALLEGHCNGNILELCRIVGTSEVTARKYLKLKVLPPAVIELLDCNQEKSRLFVGTATKLTSLPQYQQTSVAQMLVGKSVQEAKAVIDEVARNPTVCEPEAVKQIVRSAMDNFALDTAIEAKLVVEQSWRSTHPWIYDPTNPNAVYQIVKINEAFRVLLGMNALCAIPNGGRDTLPRKRTLEADDEVITID